MARRRALAAAGAPLDDDEDEDDGEDNGEERWAYRDSGRWIAFSEADSALIDNAQETERRGEVGTRRSLNDYYHQLSLESDRAAVSFQQNLYFALRWQVPQPRRIGCVARIAPASSPAASPAPRLHHLHPPGH